MKIRIATPTQGDKIHTRTARQIVDLVRHLERFGMYSTWDILPNETYVELGRDILVRSFMQSDDTHLLFIDSDVYFSPGHVQELINHEKLGVVAGLYPFKKIDWGKVHNAAQRMPAEMLAHVASSGMVLVDGKKRYLDPRKPVKVRAAATGMMLIQRKVFETLEEKFPDDYYIHERVQGKVLNHFKLTMVGDFMGEDVYFCDKVQRAGMEVYILPWVSVGHIGLNVFYGCPWCYAGASLHEFRGES